MPVMVVDRLIWLAAEASRLAGMAAGWLAPAMMLVQTALVMMLFFFGLASLWFQESVLVMHGALFMLASAWTLKENEHVRVDVFYQSMSAYRRAWVDCLGVCFFLLPVAGLGLYTSLPYVYFSWQIGETSREIDGIQHLWLFKAVMPLGFALLCLQGVAMALAALKIICGQSSAANA